MKCVDCLYFWKEMRLEINDEGEEDWFPLEKYPRCHWESKCPDDLPPCEEI